LESRLELRGLSLGFKKAKASIIGTRLGVSLHIVKSFRWPLCQAAF
jgi:hypothetical protein